MMSRTPALGFTLGYSIQTTIREKLTFIMYTLSLLRDIVLVLKPDDDDDVHSDQDKLGKASAKE